MPNQIITPDVLASRGLAHLYNETVFLPLVFRDFDKEFTAKQGDTITVRTPATFEALPYDRDNGIEIQDINEGSFPVTLDTVRDVSFKFTAEELTLELDDFDERLLKPAMEAHAQAIDADIAQALADAANASGGGGVVDDSGDSVRRIPINARAKLGRKSLPTSDRFAVYSPEAAAELLNDDLFSRADARGDTDGLREASIGRHFGFDHFESNQLNIDDNPADGVAFHRSAVAFVTRTLAKPMGKTGETAAVKSYKGIGLRVVFDYDQDQKSDVCSVDLLYGIKRLRPQAAVELDFGPLDEVGS